MLSLKNRTIIIHLKLDTWKEPRQKKHIKDPMKHDFKGSEQLWASGKQPALVSGSDSAGLATHLQPG
jgi:hypothetical protein